MAKKKPTPGDANANGVPDLIERPNMGPTESAFHVAQGLAAGFGYQDAMREHSTEDSILMASTEFITFHAPTEILISRHYPGYRMFDLSGKNADEALGLLLASTVDTEDDLEEFRRTLASPDVAQTIITTLFPRVSTPLSRGKYTITERAIADVTGSVLGGRGSNPNVVTAIAYVITRILHHMNLVLVGPEKKLARKDDSLAITMSSLKRVIILESMRDIFSEARIAEGAKRLDADSSPNIVGEVIGDLLRNSSHAMPEIRLRLEQLDIVQALIQHYHRNPAQLTNTMRASSTLSNLATYANFLADSVDSKFVRFATADNSDMREACNQILTIIQSAPSIESIPLSKFAEFFGLVPCSASDGVYRGLVVYMPLSQASKLDVVNVVDFASGSELSLIPSEYVPITVIAPELNRTILSLDAATGLANLVADEISARVTDVGQKPILRTSGVSDVDIIYLAMAQSQMTGVVKTDDDSMPFRLIYAVRVGEHWRSWIDAASPDIAYFADPQSALIYVSGATSQIPTALPARHQTLDLSASYDTQYSGDVEQFIEKDIQKPFFFDIVMENPGGDDIDLKLRINPLELLVGKSKMPDRGGAYYGIIKEPGVDRDIVMLLSLASAYARAESDVLSDKAKSWIVEVMTPLAAHPAITRLAVRAFNQAIVDNRLDARRFSTQYKQAMVKSYFGTLLGLMMRMGKLDDNIRDRLLKDLPVNSLSVKAALSLASMPIAVDASDN
jgi:hypothetical protein